jgi:hypothetical protein
MHRLIQILRDQGLRVEVGPGLNANPTYWITDTEHTGKRAGLSGQDLENLFAQGKLNWAGIEEHDERIRRMI